MGSALRKKERFENHSHSLKVIILQVQYYGLYKKQIPTIWKIDYNKWVSFKVAKEEAKMDEPRTMTAKF